MSDDFYQKRMRQLERQQESLVRFRVGIAIFAIALLVIGMVAQPIMEARAYNKLTGKNVSAWDAFWVDLRVQDGAK